MNRFRQYGDRDDPMVTDGDSGWRFVDMRRSPEQLEDGVAAYAENMRFDRGIASTRRGIRKMAWAAPVVTGYSTPFIQPYAHVIAAETWNDPVDAVSWLIIVTRDPDTEQMTCYKAQPGVSGSLIPSPAGETVPERIMLVQTYDGIVMLRGPGREPLYMADVANGFKVLPEPAAAINTKIPPADQGIYFQNRLLVVDARPELAYRDTIWVSDFGTTASVLEGNGTWNSFRINVGSRDLLVAVYKFNDTTLIAAKSGSIYAISGVSGTNEEVQANAVLDAITTEYGCHAPRSFVQVGSDVWFLAHRHGIVSIQQTATNKLQGVDVPKSREIQPLIDRINWEHAQHARAAFADNRVYFAVPLDDSTYNNAVLVYDVRNQGWCGVDTGAAIQVKDFLRYWYGGVERLHFLSDDGHLNLYEDGAFDHVSAAGVVTYASVVSVLRTRGYGGRAAGRKKLTRVQASLRTWWPNYRVRLLLPGAQEAKVVRASITADRRKYRRPSGRPDFNPAVPGDTFMDPYREDYSMPPGGAVGASGVMPDQMQEYECDWPVKSEAEYAVVELTSTQGRIEVTQAAVDACTAGVVMRRKV